MFAEYGGYDAEARAAAILTDAGIPESRHNGPMREVPPGLKLRVLLAQALFSRPDVLLLDEPTNNLDINSIRWLESMLNNYDATMIIISHDRHFLNQVCTHIADLDYQQLQDLSRQLRRLHAGLGAGARSGSRPRTPRPRTASPICRSSCGASRPTPPRRARRPRARSSWRRSRSRRSGRRRGRTLTSASSRARSCIARRSRWRSCSSAIRARTSRC